MADTKNPDEKDDAKPATPPDAEAAAELNDDQLDKIAGGLARQRFDSPRIRALTST
jgi:hypothetical protein